MADYRDEMQYSQKYADDHYEYRHVILPEAATKKMYIITRFRRFLEESEWRDQLGVAQSRGWVHYHIHRPEPHILMFRRPLGTQPTTGNLPADAHIDDGKAKPKMDPEKGVEVAVTRAHCGSPWRKNPAAPPLGKSDRLTPKKRSLLRVSSEEHRDSTRGRAPHSDSGEGCRARAQRRRRPQTSSQRGMSCLGDRAVQSDETPPTGESSVDGVETPWSPELEVVVTPLAGCFIPVRFLLHAGVKETLSFGRFRTDNDVQVSDRYVSNVHVVVGLAIGAGGEFDAKLPLTICDVSANGTRIGSNNLLLERGVKTPLPNDTVFSIGGKSQNANHFHVHFREVSSLSEDALAGDGKGDGQAKAKAMVVDSLLPLAMSCHAAAALGQFPKSTEGLLHALAAREFPTDGQTDRLKCGVRVACATHKVLQLLTNHCVTARKVAPPSVGVMLTSPALVRNNSKRFVCIGAVPLPSPLPRIVMDGSWGECVVASDASAELPLLCDISKTKESSGASPVMQVAREIGDNQQVPRKRLRWSMASAATWGPPLATPQAAYPGNGREPLGVRVPPVTSPRALKQQASGSDNGSLPVTVDVAKLASMTQRELTILGRRLNVQGAKSASISKNNLLERLKAHAQGIGRPEQ